MEFSADHIYRDETGPSCAEQNECRFYFSIKHTMTDPAYKIQSGICSSVTTWDANAAVFFLGGGGVEGGCVEGISC